MPIRSLRTSFWLPFAFAMAASACGSGAPLSPSDLALLTLTDTFSGTLAVGATAVHPFASRAGGTIGLTLTAVGPGSAPPLGLGLGSWDGATCAVQVSTTEAVVGTAYQATVSAAGNYCASLSDVGRLTEDATYTLQVTRP